MSVLIKGMDMPKLGDVFRVGRDVNGNLFICEIFAEETVWFPLAEVPTPHGRLIDADKLDRAAQKEWDDNEITSGEWVRARERIKNVPTVIEREWLTHR